MAVMLRPVERSGRQPDDRPSVQFQPPILCNFTPPLTRGTRCWLLRSPRRTRIIPARAGNAHSRTISHTPEPDHPRG